MAKESTAPTPTPASVEEMQAQLDALISERDAATNESEKLRAAIKLAGKASLPIRGTFKATVVRNGESVEKTYGFADGHANVRLKDIGIVPTEELLSLASGKKMPAEKLAEFPGLRALTTADGSSNGTAEKQLQRLADIGYGYLVER